MVYGVWGVFGRDGGFLHACSCPESQVTWEPGWDNKGGRGRVGGGRGQDAKTRGVTFGR